MSVQIAPPAHPPQIVPEKAKAIPPLNSGDVLSRPEFERRYHAHPEIKKAELIEGVVYIHSAFAP